MIGMRFRLIDVLAMDDAHAVIPIGNINVFGDHTLQRYAVLEFQQEKDGEWHVVPLVNFYGGEVKT